MKFSCQECGSQYLLDDGKIGPGGVKVRCKRCQSFIVVKLAESDMSDFEDDQMATQVVRTNPAWKEGGDAYVDREITAFDVAPIADPTSDDEPLFSQERETSMETPRSAGPATRPEWVIEEETVSSDQLAEEEDAALAGLQNRAGLQPAPRGLGQSHVPSGLSDMGTDESMLPSVELGSFDGEEVYEVSDHFDDPISASVKPSSDLEASNLSKGSELDHQSDRFDGVEPDLRSKPTSSLFDGFESEDDSAFDDEEEEFGPEAFESDGPLSGLHTMQPLPASGAASTEDIEVFESGPDLSLSDQAAGEPSRMQGEEGAWEDPSPAANFPSVPTEGRESEAVSNFLSVPTEGRESEAVSNFLSVPTEGGESEAVSSFSSVPTHGVDGGETVSSFSSDGGEAISSFSSVPTGRVDDGETEAVSAGTLVGSAPTSGFGDDPLAAINTLGGSDASWADAVSSALDGASVSPGGVLEAADTVVADESLVADEEKEEPGASKYLQEGFQVGDEEGFLIRGGSEDRDEPSFTQPNLLFGQPSSDAEPLEQAFGAAFDSVFAPSQDSTSKETPSEDETSVAAVVETASQEPPPIATSEPSAAWYVAISDERVGPLTLSEVKARMEAGDVTSSTLSWRKGMVSWTPVDQVPELDDALSGLKKPSSSSAAFGSPSNTITGEVRPSIALESLSKTAADEGPSWQPSAASALSALAAEELASQPDPRPAASKPMTGQMSAIPAASTELSKLLDGAQTEEGTASMFGLGEKSVSKVRAIPRRAETMAESLSERPAPSPVASPKRVVWWPLIAAALCTLLLSIGGVFAWVWFQSERPEPVAVRVRPTPSAEDVKSTITNPAPGKEDKPQASEVADSAAATTDPTPPSELVAAEPTPADEPPKVAAEPTPADEPPKVAPKPKSASRKIATRSRRRRAPKPAASARPPPRPASARPSAARSVDDLLNPAGRKPKAPPKSAVRSGLDDAEVFRVLRRHKSEVRDCIAKHTGSGGDTGRVRVSITIQPTGRVSRTRYTPSSFNGSVLGRCLASEARAWEFPRFAGKATSVDFPVTVK